MRLPDTFDDRFISTRHKEKVRFNTTEQGQTSTTLKPRGILKNSTSSLESAEPQNGDLNQSVGGTPRNILRERLRNKDLTITELKELQVSVLLNFFSFCRPKNKLSLTGYGEL